MLILPASIFRFTISTSIFRFTFDPTNPNISPLVPFIEPIFYLGILGGILPMVMAIGYFITFEGIETDSAGFLFQKKFTEKQPSNSAQIIKVFLCYASEDKPSVRQLHARLLEKGFSTWFDENSLLPGQDWKLEIAKAVRNSDIVIICLSQKSIDKTGFVQKEIKYALDISDEKPESQIFLIPARLEECDVPDSLKEKQWVDLFTKNGFDRLVAAISTRVKTYNMD